MKPLNIALLAALSACGSSPLPASPTTPSTPPSAAPPSSAALALTAVSVAPSATAAAPAPSPDDKFAAVTIKVEKVAGSVYMLEGMGGNIAASIGEDGIVLVDDQYAPLASKIQQALKGISDRSIRVVLNTHWHGDHTGGNAAVFASTGAPIVAHENVRKRLMTGRGKLQVGDHTSPEVPPAPKNALPILTFEDKVSVHLNGEDIRAFHLPSGHTDGDVVIYFTQSKVVHMGDDFVTYGFPFVDVTSGGTIRGIIAAMDKVSAELPADVRVIPGHGKVSSLEDVKKLAASLKDCVSIVAAEVKKGKSLTEIQKAKPLAKYDELGKGMIKTDLFVEMLVNELTQNPHGKLVPH